MESFGTAATPPPPDEDENENALVYSHDKQVIYNIREGVTQQAGTRATGVKRAWKLEQDLVRKTGRGSRNWTRAQIKELLTTGEVKGFQGHHINNVAQFPIWAGDPRNIRFLSRRSYFGGLQGHRRNYQTPTRGRLIDREAMINRNTK